MVILKKTGRSVAYAIAALFIAFGLLGIVGAWVANHFATDVARRVFGVVETSVQVINSGVMRMDELVATSRAEVKQATVTITTVGPRAESNRPVLIALNDRLGTSLIPRIARIQKALAPVRDAVATVGSVVSFLNSIPSLSESAPRLTTLDEALNRLEELSADSEQFRGTLRALVSAQQGDLTSETVATIKDLAQRIDLRLAEVQSRIQGVQSEIAQLQTRLEARKSRVLGVCNLVAILATLMSAWIIYSQVVVIRYHRFER